MNKTELELLRKQRKLAVEKRKLHLITLTMIDDEIDITTKQIELAQRKLDVRNAGYATQNDK